jgi:hypothetical protein
VAAARAVMAAEEVPRLMEEAKAAQKAALRSHLALQTLMNEFEKEPWKKASFGPAVEEAFRFFRIDPTYSDWDNHQTADTYYAYFDALMEDANAML